MRWSLFACLVVFGCGSGAPAKSADAAAGEADGVAEPKPAAESTSEKADKAEPSEKSGAPTTAATKEDVQAILQLVLDDDALGPYLHLERPDRFPLRIGGRDLPEGLELTKATKPVVIVPDPDADKKPVIVFMEVKVEGDEANVRYRYDVEKVRGSSTLKHRDGHWVLTRSRVTEH